jgi:hypothetical protein
VVGSPVRGSAPRLSFSGCIAPFLYLKEHRLDTYLHDHKIPLSYVIVMSPARIQMPVQSFVKILPYLRAVTAPTSV